MKVIYDAGINISPVSFWKNEEGDFEDVLQDSYQNCSRFITEHDIYCSCSHCDSERCVLCCQPMDCCYCYDCEQCWSEDWGLVTATQIIIFLLFIIGIITVIIMYFKICSRSTQTECRNHTVLQNECNNECVNSISQHSFLQDSRDKPPSYSEACSAPPLYTCPYNRVSMLEAPPVYPETPKSSKRTSRSSNSPTIAHHI